MKLIETDFDKFYEELNKLNEAGFFQPSLFPTKDYILYDQLEAYFNTYYFNAGKKTLLPPVDDEQGWEIVSCLKNIEENIINDKAFSYSAFARICTFYNTYVVEHYLLDNILDSSYKFAPDKNRKDDDDFMYLPSHEYLRGGAGYSGADFVGKLKGRNITIDLKFKPGKLKDIETWNAHGADYVYCYAVGTNKLFIYKYADSYNLDGEKKTTAIYKQEDSGEQDLEKTLPNKLIPQYILNQSQYNHWANVFSERNAYLRANKNK